MTSVSALGPSAFNYSAYGPERFLHYYQQITHALRFSPKTVLEVGPGDHTVTDFLRRKGVEVETYDNDPLLEPTYIGDVRQPLEVPKRYDMVLASEVVEHMNVRWLPSVLRNLRDVLKEDGVLVLSVPYTTLRLFDPHGRIVSCEGRFQTGVPMYQFYRLAVPLLFFYRWLVKGLPPGVAIRVPGIPDYADDRFDVHHWDLGYQPTTRRLVREILRKEYSILDEQVYLRTNCVFFTLKKPAALS